MKNLTASFFRGIEERPIFCSLSTAKKAVESAHPGHPTVPEFVRSAMKALPGSPVHCGWGIWAEIREGMRCFVIPRHV